MMSSMALLHFLGQDNQIEMLHDFFGYVIPLALASHDTSGIVLAYGTDVSTGTSTSTKGHIIPLNHHCNITNAMVSLMTPLPSSFYNVHDKN